MQPDAIAALAALGASTTLASLAALQRGDLARERAALKPPRGLRNRGAASIVVIPSVIAPGLVGAELLPATMKLLGDRNWYLPGWLAWLPRIGGEPIAAPLPSPAATAVPACLPTRTDAPKAPTPLLRKARTPELATDSKRDRGHKPAPSTR